VSGPARHSSQASPPCLDRAPALFSPFSHVCIDVLRLDSTYLAIVDRYTNWISGAKLGEDSASNIMEVI
jgi:hypothetical protein